MIMYFADCPRCGKPDSSANGFDLCEECREIEDEERVEEQPPHYPQMQLQEVEDDDHSQAAD